jgi:hypothetical protein
MGCYVKICKNKRDSEFCMEGLALYVKIKMGARKVCELPATCLQNKRERIHYARSTIIRVTKVNHLQVRRIFI